MEPAGVSTWSPGFAVLFVASAALAMGQDLAVENAIVSTTANVGVSSSDEARPITAKQRAQWVVFNTLGPQAIIGEGFSAGLGPGGIALRIRIALGWLWQAAGADLSEAAVSHTMEAGLRAVWAEDPRYFRDAGAPLKNRLAHVFVMTFVARNRDGNPMLAYARFIAIPRSSALAGTRWPESERSVGSVRARIRLGVLGRMGADAFAEFWPDVRQLIFRRKLVKAASQTCSRTKKTLQASDRPSPIDHSRSLFDDSSFPPPLGKTISSESAQQNMKLERSVR